MFAAKANFKDKILYIIIILLGCHQFPVIRVGGSLKTYDILGILLMFYNILKFKSTTKTNYISFLAFIFFVIIPIFTYTYSSIFMEYPSGYYSRFASRGDITSFRSNYYFFPLFQLLLLGMNYAVFSSIKSSTWLYENFDKVLKAAITMGTIIAIYALFAFFVYDFIPLLPTFIQFKKPSFGRTSGFSQEPGTYVFYQAWITLFVYFSKKLFTRKKWNILFIINLVALLLTLSSTLAGLILILLFVQFTYRSKASKQIKSFFYVLAILGASFAIIVVFKLQKTMETFFIEKFEKFLAGKSNDNTGTSGATRSFFNGIGFKIFSDNIFSGVGQGRSTYYMYLYEFKMGIKQWGERINPGATPMGILPLVMAEQGIIGLIPLLLFYFSLIKRFWINRTKSSYHKMFLIGTLFLGCFFFTFFPVYHVFLWAYPALGLGYLKYFDSQQKLNKMLVSEQEYIH